MLQPIHFNPPNNVAVDRSARLAPGAGESAPIPAPVIAVRIPQRNGINRYGRAGVCMVSSGLVVAGLASLYGSVHLLLHVSQDFAAARTRGASEQPADDIVRASTTMLAIFVALVALPVVTVAAMQRIIHGAPSAPVSSDLGHALDDPDGGRLPDAANFEHWISGLGEAMEAGDPAARTQAERVATEIVQAMHDHPELRPLCIAAIERFAHTEGEPVLLALEPMRAVIALERIFREGMDGARITELAVSRMVRNLVNAQVRAAYPNDPDAHVELGMAYQSALNERLGLRLSWSGMVQGRLSNVSEHRLTQIEHSVRAELADPAAMRKRIQEWQPLRERVERAFAKELDDLSRSFHAEMEALEAKTSMREYDLVVALDEVKDRSLGADKRFVDDKILELVDPHLDAALKPRLAV